MLPLDDQQQAARDWFEALRDRICCAFEAIEREAGSDAAFTLTPWDRNDATGEPGGGGVRGQMAGKVFEKVGVNVSAVGGQFSPEFAKSIPGAEDDPSFFATGISLVLLWLDVRDTPERPGRDAGPAADAAPGG